MCAAVMIGQIVIQDTVVDKERVVHKVHEDIRRSVKDGAGRPYPDHKAAYG